MARVFRRRGALVVVSLLITAMLSGTAAEAQSQPVAWLALRSYQRLEQRLREISTMAQTPGLADMMLGMAQLQLAGLGGVDRQRPLGVVIPTVSLSGQPPVVVLIPYTDRDTILQTLRNFFPQTLIEDGVRLSLQGGPVPAFGRLDTQANMLVLGSTPEALQGATLALPADLFGAKEDGPDLVFRVDLQAAKSQLGASWMAMLTNMEQVWQKALQKAAEDKVMSAAEKTAMTTYLTMTQKALRQGLDDVMVGESRLTLAPSGWVFDLETTMRPDSPSAALFNSQTGQAARLLPLFPPSPNALLRMGYSVRMTESLRQDITALLPSIQQMFDAKVAALPALTPEQRTAGTKVVASYIGILEQWYAQKALEAAMEVQTLGTGFEMTGVLPFADSPQVMGTVLEALEHLPLFTDKVVAKVTRDAEKHQGTTLHHVDLSKAATLEVPPRMFLATLKNVLTLHLGSTVTPLYGVLDRIAAHPSQAQTSRDAMAHMELFIAPLLKLGMSTGQAGKAPDPFLQALLTRLQQGPSEPLTIDVLRSQDGTTVRSVAPGSLVQSFAEVIGQQVSQQLRGGNAKKDGGSKPPPKK